MKFIIYIALFFPLIMVGQVSFDSIPTDRQLIPRDVNTNLGTIVIRGNANIAEANYDAIRVLIKRDATDYDVKNQDLVYADNIAPFEFEFNIPAELIDYQINVYGVKSNDLTLEHMVDEIVAGDVYIIQGQSNAESKMRDSDSSSDYISQYIRVYANGTEYKSNLVSNDNWFLGQGDGRRTTDGNTGQYGLKLAHTIVNAHQVPVAIFNGGHGAQEIAFFLRDADNKYSLDDNYGRMYYRIEQTGLASHVRAIIWSQGEWDGRAKTTESEYISMFNDLHSAWQEDYPSLEQTYILQTSNGCGINLDDVMIIKEAQRKIAESDQSIAIIPTAAPINSNDDCHFKFENGYSAFADRLYNLISTKFYGNDVIGEFNAPNILDAYMIDDKTIVLQTDATTLDLNNCDPANFRIDDANGSSIESLEVSEADLIVNLSTDPGETPKISFIGPLDGISRDFIVNSSGLEILSFYQFPINVNNYTVWNGTSWSKGTPDDSKYVTISGNFDSNSGSLEALDLTISQGADLNFDTGSHHSVIVHGDLSIQGSFVLGDQESLVMHKSDAQINGSILKKERSTNRLNAHDITYWSSPVENETIESVFQNVTKSRIFYYDQDQSSATRPEDDPNYWNIWRLASGQMTSAQGYASEGRTNTTGVHDISFWGTPNNGDISIQLKGHFDDDDDDGDKDNNFNLVGNPYPSAINITDFFDENKDVIDETVYLWTHATPVSGSDQGDFVSADYATYNRSGGTASSIDGQIPRDTLGSGQGFFIRAISAGQLEFKNTMRRAGQNTIFFKPKGPKKSDVSKQQHRIWLELTSDKGGFNQILVNFSEKGTTAFDKGYDAFKINSNNPISFFSTNASEKYAIQCLPPYPQEQKINLGIASNVGPRMLKIGIKRKEGVLEELPIKLVDHYLQKVHDLNESDYSFEIMEKSTFIDRFSLHFSDVKITKQKKNATKLRVSINGKILKVKANKDIMNIKIYNVYGALIAEDQPLSKVSLIDLKQSHRGEVLFIHAYLKNGQMTTKKIICR